MHYVTIIRIVRTIIQFASFSLLGLWLSLAHMDTRNWRIFAVGSDSMTPTLTKGSLVLVVKQKQYHEGEVITFQTEANSFRTHRIISITNDDKAKKYVTRGDANQFADGVLVPESKVIGRAQLQFPWLGYISLLLKNFHHQK